jgi:hypothetical protein
VEASLSSSRPCHVALLAQEAQSPIISLLTPSSFGVGKARVGATCWDCCFLVLVGTNKCNTGSEDSDIGSYSGHGEVEFRINVEMVNGMHDFSV